MDAGLIDRGKHPVLGVQVSAIDYAAAVARVIDAAEARRPLIVSALAVHGIMEGALDPELRYRLNRFDLIVPDGQPVRWVLNGLHGAALPDRVYGPALMLEVCRAAADDGLPIFLYGSRPEVLEALRGGLMSRFPALKIAGSEPSKFRQTTAAEQDEIAERITASGAALAFVGLGCPRQEVFAFEYRSRLSMPLLAVGAAFDFHAGLLPQAPAWMQRRGLEWAFRLAQEPRRLWRRYLLLNPAFVTLVALQAVHLRRFAEEREPPDDVRYG